MNNTRFFRLAASAALLLLLLLLLLLYHFPIRYYFPICLFNRKG